MFAATTTKAAMPRMSARMRCLPCFANVSRPYPDNRRLRGNTTTILSLPCGQSPLRARRHRLGDKMLRQLQSLRLIIRADVAAIKPLRPLQHLLINQTSHHLAMFENERHFARSDFKNGAGAEPTGAG